MLSVLSAIAVKVAVPLVSLLTSWGLAEGSMYIRSKTKNELIDSALTRITHTVNTTVADLSQTMAKELREKTEDGRLSLEDARSLKRIAIDDVKEQVPAKIQKLAEAGVRDIDKFIGAKIEQAVMNQKAIPSVSRLIKVSKGE